MRRVTGVGLLIAAVLTTTSTAQNANSPSLIAQISVDRGEPLFEFHVGYSPVRDAALQDYLEREARRLENEGRAQLQESEALAARETPRGTVSRHVYWHDFVLTGDNRLLSSMRVTHWEATGGPHGNGWADSLLWDRARRRPINFADLFSDWRSVRQQLRAPICIAIDRARFVSEGAAASDYAPHDSGDGSGLPEQCPAVEDFSLALIGQDGEPFDGLLVRHSGGTYAEGILAADIPMTAALITQLRREWRPAFRAAPVDGPAPSP